VVGGSGHTVAVRLAAPFAARAARRLDLASIIGERSKPRFDKVRGGEIASVGGGGEFLGGDGNDDESSCF
jgi:hypothetical protein